MARATLVLDADWSQGIIRDAPRGAIPQGGVYNATDFLLHQPGIAVKRGGTSYAGPAMTAASYAYNVGYHQATSTIFAVGDNGHIYSVTSGTTTDRATLGSAYLSLDTPKYRVGASKNLLVFTANDGTSAPKVCSNGTTVATLGGTPPAGKYAAVYKTRLALANVSANPDRIYFSDVPDIESTWDTTNSWIDNDYPVTGLAALQNTLVVFSAGKTHRITGTTPPPGSDFDHAPIGDVGCTDARSIVIYEGRAIFANDIGVYWTDGTTYQCMTRQAGIETLWRGLFATASQTHIASGILGSFLIVCVRDSSDATVATLMCNLARNAWWQLTNVNAISFITPVGVAGECYYADKSTNRVTALSGMLAPVAGNKNDANGTAVAPLLETRLLAAGPTLKHYGFGHLSLDMRDASADNPTLAVSFAPGLEATTFAAVTESPLAETTDNSRARFTIAKVSQGGALRFQQTNASSKTELYALELETRPLSIAAGGQ